MPVSVLGFEGLDNTFVAESVVFGREDPRNRLWKLPVGRVRTSTRRVYEGVGNLPDNSGEEGLGPKSEGRDETRVWEDLKSEHRGGRRDRSGVLTEVFSSSDGCGQGAARGGSRGVGDPHVLESVTESGLSRGTRGVLFR